MVCMEHLLTQMFGLKSESAMPAVDQPVDEVDKMEVDKMVCVHFTMSPWSIAATLFSFISLNNNT